MTPQQMYTLIVANFISTGVLIVILMAYINAKIETVRAELRRVEEVLDARLKHLEEH